MKTILLLAAAGAGVWAVSRVQPPVPTGSTAATDSMAIAEVSLGAKFQYSVGAMTGAIIGGSIKKSVQETEQSLVDLRKEIKAAKGADGVRARDLAKKITHMDSAAVENLYQGRPIKAMKQSMEAKSLLNAVRTNLKIGV